MSPTISLERQRPPGFARRALAALGGSEWGLAACPDVPESGSPTLPVTEAAIVKVVSELLLLALALEMDVPRLIDEATVRSLAGHAWQVGHGDTVVGVFHEQQDAVDALIDCPEWLREQLEISQQTARRGPTARDWCRRL